MIGSSPWFTGGSGEAFAALCGGVSRVGAWLSCGAVPGRRQGLGGRDRASPVPRPGAQANRGPHGPRRGRGWLGVAGRTSLVDRAHAAAAHTRLGERGLGHVRHGQRRACGLGGAAQRHLWPLRARYAARPGSLHTHHDPGLYDTFTLRTCSPLTRTSRPLTSDP